MYLSVEKPFSHILISKKNPIIMRNKLLLTLLMVALIAVIHSTTATSFKQALGNYVNQPESAYSYKLINTRSITGATIYTLNVTSLTWLPTSEVGPANTWFHYLEINCSIISRISVVK